MNSIGVITILFLIFAVLSYSNGNYDNTVVHLEIAAVLGVISLFLQKEKNKSEEFILWVFENMESIKRGTAMYKGKQITMETEVVQFQTCISILLLTTKSPSRFFISGQNNVLFASFVFTIVTLIVGWWGIPWGPIYTIQTVIKNLMGGHRKIIGEMVKNIESTVELMEKQPDEHSSPV